jgi:ferritin-like metal-binding protein YciE
MSTDNVTDSEVQNARVATAAVADVRIAAYKIARRAAREVGCQEYYPSFDHCLRELQVFVDRSLKLLG